MSPMELIDLSLTKSCSTFFHAYDFFYLQKPCTEKRFKLRYPSFSVNSSYLPVEESINIKSSSKCIRIRLDNVNVYCVCISQYGDMD